MTSEVDLYSVGFVCASVCTSLEPDEMLKRVNAENPSGTSHGWVVSADKTFRQGKPNPCPCEDHPDTHKHYLLAC